MFKAWCSFFQYKRIKKISPIVQNWKAYDLISLFFLKFLHLSIRHIFLFHLGQYSRYKWTIKLMFLLPFGKIICLICLQIIIRYFSFLFQKIICFLALKKKEKTTSYAMPMCIHSCFTLKINQKLQLLHGLV